GPLRPARPRPRGVLPRPPGRPAAGRHAEPGRQHHVEALSAHLHDDPLPRAGPGRLGGPRLPLPPRRSDEHPSAPPPPTTPPRAPHPCSPPPPPPPLCRSAPPPPPRPGPPAVLPPPPARPAAGRHAEPGRQHHVEALSAHLHDDPLPRAGPGRLGGPRLLVRLG